MSTTAIPGSTRAAAQTLTAVGRVFFALGLIGLGISHFVFGDFMTGRAPAWPDGVPGGTAWAYGTGVVFIAIGAAILVRRGGRLAALFAAVLIFGWALLRNIPVVAADRLLGGMWTQGGKSLTLLGGALAVAATLSGIMVFSWFWIVHLPRTFASVSDGIAVFEALAVAGIAFVLAGSLETGRER